MSFIIADNLVKRYGRGDAAVTALGGVSLSVEEGRFVSVVGQSGSGKSTLLTILGALNTPTQGRYLVGGVDIYRMSADQRADVRRRNIGFVFQSFHLAPYLSLIENVMLPLTVSKISNQKKRAKAAAALARVGLTDKADRRPNQVSGGEQERAAIARAVVDRPPIILADEPTGNLDGATGREVMGLLKSLNDGGVTIIMVTHSEEYAAWASRMIRLKDGLLASDEKLTPIACPAQADPVLTLVN